MVVGVVGIAYDRQSPALSFHYVILPWFKDGTHLLLVWQWVFQMKVGGTQIPFSNFLHHNWACLTTVKILKIGTPEIITVIVLQLEQLDFTVQYCVQNMQTE